MSFTASKEVVNDGVIRVGRTEIGLLTAAGADTFLANTLVALDTATQNYVPYVIGGTTNGNGIVAGALTEEKVAAGAGDIPVTIYIDADIQTHKAVVHADGDASNIDANVKLLCRDKGITLVDTKDLYVADNGVS
jgi:hypothetical protein